MRLDRNVSEEGRDKYALLNLRRNTIEWGRVGDFDEFFVIKLRDRHAPAALLAYAESIGRTDPEFAEEVRELAARSGEASPFCKEPD